jgi:hypothetical protein
MKRILGTVVALAGVLGFSTISSAAIINFDISGTGSVDTVSQFAPSPPGFFTTPFNPGSTVQINTDRNGDSVTGDVALVSGTLNINATTPLGALGTIVTNVVVSLAGGTGTLTGQTIMWDLTGPTYIVGANGVFHCTGAICGILQFPAGFNPPFPPGPLTPGFDYPIAGLSLLTGAQNVNPIILGEWDLDAGLANILASSRATNSLGGPTPPPGPGLPGQWYLFGTGDLGHTIPEPGAFALVLLGISGLALRSRKA